MSFSVYNIRIHQGESHRFTLTLVDSRNNPIDTTGYSIRGQARRLKDATGSLAYQEDPIEFECSFVQPQAVGQAQIFISPSETQSLHWGQFEYDIVLQKGSDQVRIPLVGRLTLLKRFTQ